MPDHLHLLVEMPGDGLSLSEWVGRLKGLTSRKVRAMGFRGWLWQGRFYERILRRPESIERVADYIVHNPVQKGLVKTWVEYPWAGMGIEDIKV
jgi:REP element-mobilizing transposase RayT